MNYDLIRIFFYSISDSRKAADTSSIQDNKITLVEGDPGARGFHIFSQRRRPIPLVTMSHFKT